MAVTELYCHFTNVVIRPHFTTAVLSNFKHLESLTLEKDILKWSSCILSRQIELHATWVSFKTQLNFKFKSVKSIPGASIQKTFKVSVYSLYKESTAWKNAINIDPWCMCGSSYIST